MTATGVFRREREELDRLVQSAEQNLLAWTPAAPVEPPARPETAAPTPDEDDGKSARDHAPRYSQVDLDMATKPLHAEIERLRAAPTPAPTREQLASIEWSATGSYQDAEACPACKADVTEWHPKPSGTHKPDCWLAAALSSPVGETPPDAVEGQCPNCGERDGAHGAWCRR